MQSKYQDTYIQHNLTDYVCQFKNLYFTSDTHFFHTNVLNLIPSRLVWTNINKFQAPVLNMNAQIQENWKGIGEDDLLFHLGDIFLCREKRSEGLAIALNKALEPLKGSVFIILGNHDQRIATHGTYLLEHVPKLVGILDYAEIMVKNPEENNDIPIILSHYPMSQWNGKTRRSVMIHGHCHGNQEEQITQIDVGIDNNNGFPYSLQEIFDIILKKIMEKGEF